MRFEQRLLFLFCCLSFLLVGCGSQKSEPQSGPDEDLPDWVLNPIVEDGLAATSCVNYSGNMDIDKSSSVASARADISKQISIKVRAMDKTYAESTSKGENASSASNFSSVSKQVSEAWLRGTRPTKVKILSIGGKKKLCTMVTMGQSKELFKKILEESQTDVNQELENKMYLEWKASKAQEEMDQEVAKNKKG